MLSVIHNPVVDESGRTLSVAMGWHDPHTLAEEYIRDVRTASYGLVEYQIVERVEIDGFPPKADGFIYDPRTYLRCWRTGRGFHEPDAVDYHGLLRQFDVVDKVNAGVVDELWLFGFPYAGYYESLMVGPRAFWCNSPPLERPRGAGRLAAPPCQRRFVVMGFNYERDVGCMLENLGHRAESILAYVFDGASGDDNLWEWFTRYDAIAPGRASVGTMHFAPNSRRDYEWGSRRLVMSDCDDWLDFPHLTGQRRLVDCRAWGNGDMRRHHLWWFERLPHVRGETRGISHNWWTYIVDPNTV
ncbi:MAG TPA: hypothetical protein VHS99_11475 [Chloroflexota bacterium]|nr:hypothetical protein [Chloroflexota bacterium]